MAKKVGAQELPRADAMTDAEFCRAILPHVSRTFTLNIRVLPEPVREPVLLAYLFCRMADTVEDSLDFPEPKRSESLRMLASILPLEEDWQYRVAVFTEPFSGDARSAEADWYLCRNSLPVFREFARIPRSKREPIVSCVREMTDGMVRYLPHTRSRGAPGPEDARGMGENTNWGPGAENGWSSLESVEDLLGYCYAVAGTVGNMLCRLFGQCSERITSDIMKELESRAVSFGYALQLTNIIKDVNRDRLRSRSFIPEEIAARHGLSTRELWDPEKAAPSRGVIRDMIRLALEHCDHAFHYTTLLPRREIRLRLFCLWPLFLALRSLALVLLTKNPFSAPGSIKIPRDEVYRTLRRTSIASPSNRMLTRLYEKSRRDLASALGS